MQHHSTCSRLGALIVIAGLFLSGCGYPEVSPTTYELSRALYSACNRRNDEHLSKAAALIEEKHQSGDITDSESQWLTAIVERARSGDWADAAAEARRIIADQVE